MHDPQHRVDCVRVQRLPDAATALGDIPLRVEVPALHDPMPLAPADLQIRVCVERAVGDECDVELKEGLRGRIQESSEAAFEDFNQAFVLCFEPHGNAPDFDDDGVGRGHWAGLYDARRGRRNRGHV